MSFEKMEQIVPGLRRLELAAEQAGRRGSTQWLLWVHDHYWRIAGHAARVRRHVGGDQTELHWIVRATLFAEWQRGVDEREVAPPS